MVLDKDVILAILDESTGLIISLFLLYLFSKLARDNRDLLIRIETVLTILKDLLMPQDYKPTSSSDKLNPWGKGSRGTVLSVAKTNNELNKTTSLTLESKKDKAMKETLKKSSRMSRPRNLDADY